MLNFQKLAGLIGTLRSDLRAARDERTALVHGACDAFGMHAAGWRELRDRLASARTTVALPVEQFDLVYDLPPVPKHYTVCATDGSQIDLERHSVLPCYCITAGQVMLRYGTGSDAKLESDVRFFYEDEDLYVGGAGERHVVQASVVAARRDTVEAEHLAALLEKNPADTLVGMLDGTLVRWNFDQIDEQVRRQLMKMYIESLERCRCIQAPVCAYISRSGSDEVVDIVRAAVCTHASTQCASCAADNAMNFSGVRDIDLFASILASGQRSSLFRSRARILSSYGAHTVYFMYIHSGSEVARVEIPQWVAEDPAMLQRVHVLVVDQARRGRGYPVALMEAHEQAVVTSRDREAFYRLIEEELAQGGEVRISEKALSKKLRMV